MRALLPIVALLAVLPQRPLHAQAADAWDSARALDLIERARARRLEPQQDTTLRNYTARAEGFVYFYLDRREGDERTLVKVDQVALELYWMPPDITRQRIVGLRDESRLPNRMHYHLDHLTVVQNGFGDLIRMGDGDEVADVPHPAAAGSDTIYSFRLSDSLTLRLPTAPEPIRVYEIQVRPRRTDRPALVGSVFVDRASADIVRMSFTFTPASYVDRRLDYISVTLDNGLWEGRYWLPHEQTLQIRRQIPELDFAAGAVIQGRMRVGDYTFNDSVPDVVFRRPALTALPPAQRREHAFERGIFDDLNDEGLGPPADLAAVRRQAAELLGSRRLSGLPKFRLGLESASSALRYNRAEGLSLGAGLTWAPGPPWRADAGAGFAFGPERPWLTLQLQQDPAPRGDALLRAVLREPRDLGLAPAMPGALNTLSAIFFGSDYTDPYYATGARLLIDRRFAGRWTGSLGLAGERHRSATLTQAGPPIGSGRFRPVRAVDEGDLSTAVLGVRRTRPDPRATDWGGGLELEIGAWGGEFYVRPLLGLAGRVASADHAHDLTLSARAGLLTERAPSQRLFLLGGPGTLPGYGHRSFGGRRFALVEAEAATAVWSPWLRLRAVGALGATGALPDLDPDAPAAWQGWRIGTTDGVRASAGGGVSLFWDLLRADVVRGLNGGSWRFILSLHTDLRDIS